MQAPRDPNLSPQEPGTGPPTRERDLLQNVWFVRGVIAAAVLVVLAATGLIYYRWISTRFPSSYIFLKAQEGESPEGAQVTISDDGHNIATVTLTASERFEAPVLVEPGLYTVTVHQDDRQIQTQRVLVPHRRVVTVLVTTRPSTTPESQPNTEGKPSTP